MSGFPSLAGMEQTGPVRSFKSFIQTVPPNPGIENQKPLPPIPSPEISETEVSIPPLVAPSPNRLLNIIPWQAPTEWEWKVSPSNTSPTDTISNFPTRRYSPLLPEPSSVPFDIQAGMLTELKEENDVQRATMDLEYGTAMERPEPPPRNPSRMSTYGRLSNLSGSASSTASTVHDNQSSLSSSRNSGSCPDSPTTVEPHTSIAVSKHSSYRVSDASTKTKAFTSLGIGSPRNSHSVWEAQTNESAPQLLLSRGRNISPFVRDNLLVPEETEESEFSDAMQQLSFSQDYHDVLVNQYHTGHAQRAEVSVHTDPQITTLSQTSNPDLAKEQGMVPQPLTWRKSSDNSSLREEPLNRRSNAKRYHFSGAKKMHKKMASWIPLPHSSSSGQRTSATEGEFPCSTGQTDATFSSDLISESIRTKPSEKSIRFPDLLAHAKGLRLPNFGSKSQDIAEITHTHSQQRLHSSGPLKGPRLPQSTTPLLRLPGGLALVRQAPSDVSQSDIPYTHHLPPSINTLHQKSVVDQPFPQSSGFRRPSSSYSQPSGVSPVESGITVGSKMRSSMYSLPSPRPHSSYSSLSTSPLAQEVFFPHPPIPPLPAKHARNQDYLPLSAVSAQSRSSQKSHLESLSGDEKIDQGLHRPGILNRAKDVRSAWKKHQKEIKHEKLKQSIKVIGPMDMAVMDSRAKRQGRILVDSNSRQRVIGPVGLGVS